MPGNQAATLLKVGRASRPTTLSMEPSQASRVGTLEVNQSVVVSSWHTIMAAPFVQYESTSLGVSSSSGSPATSLPIARWISKTFSLEIELLG
jgi:hypothetical protein